MSKKEKEINEVSANAGDGTKSKKNLKKLKYGSMSTVVIILFIALVVLANLMCGMLMKRYPIKFDLTPDNRHEISEQSITAMEELDKDVEIIVTAPESYFTSLKIQYENQYYMYGATDWPFDIIPDILEKYSVYASSGKGSVTVKYVDITKDPNVAKELNKNYSGTIAEGGIAFRCGDRVKFITADEVAAMVTPSQTSTQGNITMVFAGENVITSCIRSVADSKVVRTAVACTLNGNSILDQNSMQTAYSFESFLSRNGYDCTEIDIGTDELSTDEYDLLVVPSTNVDFTDGIISKIGDFLYNDGNYEKNMIYVPNINATGLSNIDAFLEDWKIKVDDTFIADETNSVIVGQLQVPACKVSDTDIVGVLANEALPTVIPFARSVSIVAKNNETIAKEVLSSYDTSYLDGTDQKGSFGVAIKSRKEKADGLDVYGSNVLVIGSQYMLSDQFLSSANTYNNAAVVLNVVNNVSGKDESSIIPEKAFEKYTLSMSTGAANVTLIVTVIVIPVLICIIGLIVLLWRKNK